MHHVEGEKNAELATLRGDTSKQLESNKQFEGDIQSFRVQNHKLKEDKGERHKMKRKLEKQSDAYMQDS